jgi:hypothetical protein
MAEYPKVTLGDCHPGYGYEDAIGGCCDEIPGFPEPVEHEKLGVLWKRGMIFCGPPGNGKRISIKATMHML